MGSGLASLVFQPPSISYSQISKVNYIWIRSKINVRIPAFYFDNGSNITILFSHGNAEDLSTVHEWFRYFSKTLKVNFLAYEYQGYGNAGGTPSEKHCYEDILAVYTYLIESLLVSPANIIIYGRSLGTGPSLFLAEYLEQRNVKIAGLILQSPMLSIFRIPFPLRYTLFFDMFSNIDRIKSVQCPVFVLHGTRDGVIPFSHGQDLFLAIAPIYRAKPLWIEGGGHNDLESFYNNDVMTFLEPFQAFLALHVLQKS